MIRVFHKRYEEDFRGETTVRDESPHVTYNWLDRRVELSQRDVRAAQARLNEARNRDASNREIERLADEVKDMRERHAHACEAKRRFSEAWKPGHGYADPELWESRVRAREEAERRRAREAAELKPERSVPDPVASKARRSRRSAEADDGRRTFEAGEVAASEPAGELRATPQAKATEP